MQSLLLHVPRTLPVTRLSWRCHNHPTPQLVLPKAPSSHSGCPGDCHLQSASPTPEPHRALIPIRSLPRFPCCAQLLSLPTSPPEAPDLQLLHHGRHPASAAAKLTQDTPSIPASAGKPSWQHPACSPASPAPRTHCSRQHPPHTPPCPGAGPPQTTLSLQSSHSRRLSAFTAQR